MRASLQGVIHPQAEAPFPAGALWISSLSARKMRVTCEKLPVNKNNVEKECLS